mmetsp:Transcript_84667/g.220414  ORF Transcript_84667/g.220414 Transcript_84667/m.220414 type:complete len:214 (+) Transcript_84667:785-1426(+)
MAQASVRSGGATCGLGLPTLRMTLFCSAVDKHRMMLSTSKPAKHSRIFAESSVWACFARPGGENGAGGIRLLAAAAWLAPSLPRSSKPLGKTPRAAAAPTPAGAEPGACNAQAAAAAASMPLAKSSGVKALCLRSWPSCVGWFVISGSWMLWASAQSFCESSKASRNDRKSSFCLLGFSCATACNCCTRKLTCSVCACTISSNSLTRPRAFSS